jgi:hypothetical protein
MVVGRWSRSLDAKILTITTGKLLPEGRYLIEWYERGKRRREAAGVTASEALDAVRRKKHQLEGKALGIVGEVEEEEPVRGEFQITLK